MRVLLVNAHGADRTAGGAEHYVDDLATGLSQRGHGVELLAAFPASATASGRPADIVLHSRDWRTDSQRRLRNHLGDLVAAPTEALRRAVERVKPDVVHTNNLPGVTTAIWEVARTAGAAVVHTPHDYYLLCPRVTLVRRDGTPCCATPRLCRFRSVRLRRWAPAVSAVVGVSEHIAAIHRDIFPRASVTIIRHARPPRATETTRPTRLRVVGYLGSLETTKGVAVVLEAARMLAGLGLKVRIAGDGRLRSSVEEAAAVGLVEYFGAVAGAEKEAFIAGSDMGLIPSVWAEPGGPPFVMLEWLAARRPVLVSRRGGLGEAARQFPGSLATEPSADAIVASVERLLRGDEFSRLAAAVEDVTREGDDRRWLGEHERVYERVCSGGSLNRAGTDRASRERRW